MPDGYRTVLNLYIFEEYSHREIAGLLGITESTVKTQFMRAKEKVRQLVKGKDKSRTMEPHPAGKRMRPHTGK